MSDILALMIPLAPFAFGGLWIWTKHRQKELEMQAQITAERAAQYAQNAGALEERVRVLERIVTSSGFDLAREIEALRLEDGKPGLGTQDDKTVN